jgi:hypothetical protein
MGEFAGQIGSRALGIVWIAGFRDVAELLQAIRID